MPSSFCVKAMQQVSSAALAYLSMRLMARQVALNLVASQQAGEEGALR